MSDTTSTASLTPPRPRRNIIHNVLFSLLNRVQGGIFTYITTRLLLKGLNVDDYGLYSVLCITSIGTVAILGRLGLAQVITRFVPEYFSQSKYRVIGRIFRVTNAIQLAFGGVLLILALILSPWIAELTHIANGAKIICVCAVGMFSYLLAENYRSLLSGLFLQGGIFFRTLFYNILRTAVVFLAIQTSDPFLAVVAAESVMYVISLLLFFIAKRRMIEPRIAADQRELEPLPWKRFGRFAFFAYINDIGALVLSQAVDLFVVTSYLGVSVVALYALSSRIIGMAYNILPISYLTEVITPLFYSEYGASKEKSKFGFSILTKFNLLLTVPLGVWLAVMGKQVVVEFFDPRYADAAKILAITSIFMPLETMRYPLGLMLQNAERNDIQLYGKILGVLKIGAALWLLPMQIGITTMAWITCLSLQCQNLFFYGWIAIKMKSGVDVFRVMRIFINGAIPGLLLFVFQSYFSGKIGVIVSAFVYAILYFGLSMIFRTFSKEERDFLNSKLPYPVCKF